MSLLAGASWLGRPRRLMSAADIIDEMMDGAEAVIKEATRVDHRWANEEGCRRVVSETHAVCRRRGLADV